MPTQWKKFKNGKKEKKSYLVGRKKGNKKLVNVKKQPGGKKSLLQWMPSSMRWNKVLPKAMLLMASWITWEMSRKRVDVYGPSGFLQWQYFFSSLDLEHPSFGFTLADIYDYTAIFERNILTWHRTIWDSETNDTSFESPFNELLDLDMKERYGCFI